MKRSRAASTLFLFALLGLAQSAAAQQQPAPKPVDPIGDFEFSTTVNGQTTNGMISIQKKDDVLTGRITSDASPELAITTVKVEQRKITITAAVPDAPTPLTVELTFEDDNKFTGSWALGTDGGSITGKRKTS